MGLFEQFPYTNFHELNLNWFLSKFKALLADWDAMEIKFASLQDAVDALHDYVNNYFDNLDVQNEINNKLDSMYESGELADLISTYYSPSNKLLFTIRTAVASSQDYPNYTLAASTDGITFTDTPVSNFLDNVDGDIGTDWTHYEEDGHHIWTITKYNTGDFAVVWTDDFETWSWQNVDLGFRSESLFPNPYVWTPQLFKFKGKYYIAVTVQTGTPVSGDTYYQAGLGRYSGIFGCEVNVDFDSRTITKADAIFRFDMPIVQTRDGYSYDSTDRAMDAHFVTTDNEIYCVYNDRYTLTIHSCYNNSLYTKFTLLTYNIFGSIGLEAPTVTAIGDGLYKVCCCDYEKTFYVNDENMCCYTRDFIHFNDFDYLCCVNVSYTGTVENRMRNPHLFIMTDKQQINLCRHYNIICNTHVRKPITKSTALTPAMVRIFNANPIALPEGASLRTGPTTPSAPAMDKMDLKPYYNTDGYLEILGIQTGHTPIELVYNGTTFYFRFNDRLWIQMWDGAQLAFLPLAYDSMTGSDVVQNAGPFDISNCNQQWQGGIIATNLVIGNITVGTSGKIAELVTPPSVGEYFITGYIGTSSSVAEYVTIKVSVSGIYIIGSTTQAGTLRASLAYPRRR